jgi:MOSC domain-containing protein YiiM
MSGSVASVNVGAVRNVPYRRGSVATAIFKTPVGGRVAVQGVNLDGDDQADRTVHGGPDRAVYAYAIEDYAWWEDQLARPLAPGAFGENLTTRGIDVNAGLIGERWRALRPGPYLAIVEQGAIAHGDPIEVVTRPAHELTIATMTRIYFFERERLAELLVPELPESWRGWVLSQLAADDHPSSSG